MPVIRTEATPTQVALIPYVERAIEVLWILAAVLVPLIFVPKFSVLSEAVNAYVEVPKTTVFRLLVGMMVILWVVEWALKGGLHKRYSMAGYSTRIWNWVAEQPSRWVVVAAIFYVIVAIISTFLSQNLWISMWGEVSGQFGYSAYTTVSYFFLFVIIATHLKTRNQLWRLLAAIVATGALVALYSIVQRFDYDPLDLGEAGSVRVSAMMANPVFAGAALVVTTLMTWGMGVVVLDRLGWSLVRVVPWVLLIMAQLMAVYFTDSRGSWMIGVPAGVLAYLIMQAFFSISGREDTGDNGETQTGRRLGADTLVLVGGLLLLSLLVLLMVMDQVDFPQIPGIPEFEVVKGLVGLFGFAGVLVMLFPTPFSAHVRSFSRTFLLFISSLVVMLVIVGLTSSPTPEAPGVDLGDPWGLPSAWVWLAIVGPIGALSFLALQFPDQMTEGSRRFTRGLGLAAVAVLIALLALTAAPDSPEPTEVDPIPGFTPTGTEEEVVETEPQAATGRGRSFRTDIWEASWGLIISRPWFAYEDLKISFARPLVGYGPEMFKYTFPLESPLGGLLSQAHNFFIHHAVEQGILGFMASVSLIIAFFAVGIRQLLTSWSTHSSTHRWILIALLAAMVGRVAEMLVGVNRESDLVTFWILLAILVVLPSVMGPAPQEETKPTSQEPVPLVDRRGKRGGSRHGRRERRAQRAGQGVANQSGALRTIGLGLVAFSLVIFLGWLSWDKNVDYFWAAVLADDARDNASEGRLEDAHRLMSQAIGKAPDVPTYYHNRARMYDVYRESAMNTEGAPTCEQFFKLPPREEPSRFTQPFARCAEESYLTNFEGYRKNITLPQAKLSLANSTLELALMERGTAATDSTFPCQTSCAQEAIVYYDELTKMIPSSWPLRNALGSAYLRLGSPEQALEPLRTSISISGQTKAAAQALYLRGLSYAALEDPPRAIDSFQRNLAVAGDDPNAGEVRLRLLNIIRDSYLGSGATAELAIEPLNRFIEVSPNPTDDAAALFLQGIAYQEIEDLEQAVATLERSIAVDETGPNASVSHIRLAEVHTILGNQAQADEHTRLAGELSQR